MIILKRFIEVIFWLVIAFLVLLGLAGLASIIGAYLMGWIV